MRSPVKKAIHELFVTDDAGESWSSDGEIPCDALLDYTFIDEKQIYMIDSSGAVFKRNLE